MSKFLIHSILTGKLTYYSQPVYKLLFHINMLYFKNIHLM